MRNGWFVAVNCIVFISANKQGSIGQHLARLLLSFVVDFV
jgi:hypothetical protein